MVGGFLATEGRAIGFEPAAGNERGFAATPGSVTGLAAEEGSDKGFEATEGNETGFPACDRMGSLLPPTDGKVKGLEVVETEPGSVLPSLTPILVDCVSPDCDLLVLLVAAATLLTAAGL